MGALKNLCSLFASMFKIGLFTFGGGYAMIPILTDEVLAHGWLTYEEILNFINALASYEKLSSEVVATKELLNKWIFVENTMFATHIIRLNNFA